MKHERSSHSEHPSPSTGDERERRKDALTEREMPIGPREDRGHADARDHDANARQETTDHAADHELGEAVIVDDIVVRRTALAFGAGALVGGIAGYGLGVGWFAVAGLSPMAAGGAGVPTVVGAVAVGALMGLAAALSATGSVHDANSAHDTQQSHERGTNDGRSGHGKGRKRTKSARWRSAIENLPLIGTVLVSVLMALSLFTIVARALGSGKASDQRNRVTWNQKNASRVGGADDRTTAVFVLQTAFPATRPENSPAVVLTVPNDWRRALAATPLIAKPTNAAVVVRNPSEGGALLDREIQRLSGGGGSSVASRGSGPFAIDPAGDPAAIAAAVDARRATATGRLTPAVIIVASDADPQWALPAGAYAARTGTPILFVTRAGVPAPTAAALARRNRKARMFLLGTDDIIPNAVADTLRRFGTVTRVAAADPVANAVGFAEFRDDGVQFGWGRTHSGPRLWSPSNAILVNPARWQDAVMAAHLARAGTSGPLLLTGRDELPARVDRYLWRQRPAFQSTPAEGPFNHIWVVGSFDRVGYLPQAWADYSQEIEQYMSRGDSAMSGFEALGTAWLILSVASAIWVAVHARRRLSDVTPTMKMAWFMFTLLLGPIALLLYVSSYNRRRRMRGKDGMVMWERPMWARVVSATVMMFGFDMMLMVLAVFVVAYMGFPIIRSGGPLYWMGTSMFLMMVLMYVIALVVMMLLFHTPMTMHERKIPSYWKAFGVGLPIMVATMAVESAGMMPTMWWAQMSFLPAMQMPTEDDFTMWTTLLMAVFVGFLVVLPFNYWAVTRGRKMGTM